MRLRSPLLAGFHPDSTLCRVEPYLDLANSSFEDSPGVPLFPRRDWVRGRGLGHALGHSLQLDLGGAYPEGPHLFRRGDVCYLAIAEGGTAEVHLSALERSHSPRGPLEPCPHTPIRTHRSRMKVITSTGHAGRVEDARGRGGCVARGVRYLSSTPGGGCNGSKFVLYATSDGGASAAFTHFDWLESRSPSS